MSFNSTEIVRIVISSNERKELAVKCNLSYIDNLGDTSSDHSPDEVALVVRTIRLLGNICDDVVRTWKAKGGDVSAFELRSYSGDSNTSVSDEARSHCGSRTSMTLRKRKSVNYDESHIPRSQESSDLAADGATSGHDRAAKRARSDITMNESLRWVPQIMLHVQTTGDSWQYNKLGLMKETADGHDDRVGSFGSLFDFTAGSSHVNDPYTGSQMVNNSQQTNSAYQDESCWLRTPPYTQNVQEDGVASLKEITRCLSALSSVHDAIGRPSIVTRVDQAVSTDKILDKDDDRVGSLNSIGDMSGTNYVMKDYVTIAHKIKNFYSSEAIEEMPGRSSRGSSTTDDVIFDLVALRVLQADGGLSAQAGKEHEVPSTLDKTG